jgi:hypothetical protein
LHYLQVDWKESSFWICKRNYTKIWSFSNKHVRFWTWFCTWKPNKN